MHHEYTAEMVEEIGQSTGSVVYVQGPGYPDHPVYAFVPGDRWYRMDYVDLYGGGTEGRTYVQAFDTQTPQPCTQPDVALTLDSAYGNIRAGFELAWERQDEQEEWERKHAASRDRYDSYADWVEHCGYGSR